MTVEEARVEYLYLAAVSVFHPRGCPWCQRRDHGEVENRWALRADAASIQLDLATAEDCARKSVAWA